MCWSERRGWGSIYSWNRGGTRERDKSGERLRRGSGLAGGLQMSAASDSTPGSIQRINLVKFGLVLGNWMERPHGLVGGRERALRVSGRGECPLARSEDRMATRKLLEVWAVLDCGDLCCISLAASAGGSAAAEHAGDDGMARHRRPRPANRPCGAWIRRRSSEQEAKRGTGDIDEAH